MLPLEIHVSQTAHDPAPRVWQLPRHLMHCRCGAQTCADLCLLKPTLNLVLMKLQKKMPSQLYLQAPRLRHPHLPLHPRPLQHPHPPLHPPLRPPPHPPHRQPLQRPRLRRQPPPRHRPRQPLVRAHRRAWEAAARSVRSRFKGLNNLLQLFRVLDLGLIMQGLGSRAVCAAAVPDAIPTAYQGRGGEQIMIKFRVSS